MYESEDCEGMFYECMKDGFWTRKLGDNNVHWICQLIDRSVVSG